MKKLIAANYMLKIAAEHAQKENIEKAAEFAKAAFKDLPQLGTAERLAVQGVTKVYRDACNDNAKEFHPYLALVKGELVTLTDVYTICPNCGIATRKNLNKIIADGLIVSDHLFCSTCAGTEER